MDVYVAIVATINTTVLVVEPNSRTRRELASEVSSLLVIIIIRLHVYYSKIEGIATLHANKLAI